MTRNLILFMAMLIGVILAVNSAKRIHSFSQTSQKVEEAEDRLEALRKENKWAESDQIRVEIERQGFVVRDTNKGSVITRKIDKN